MNITLKMKSWNNQHHNEAMKTNTIFVLMSTADIIVSRAETLLSNLLAGDTEVGKMP